MGYLYHHFVLSYNFSLYVITITYTGFNKISFTTLITHKKIAQRFEKKIRDETKP